MEDGKRLENLSWRLWNRETFCCARPTTTKAPRQRQQHPQQQQQQQQAAGASAATKPTSAIATSRTATADIPVPELSSSLDSASSESIVEDHDQSLTDSGDDAPTHLPRARPELRRRAEQNRACEKHITPIDLEKIVISIKETKTIESMELSLPKSIPVVSEPEEEEHEQEAATTPHPSSSHATLLESSSSTVATEDSKSSRADSQDSSSTEMSGHSIIRGFVPGGAPSSYRSQTHLPVAQPTPILKTPSQHHAAAGKKKGAMFTIGTSSGEDESSLDSHMRIPSMPKSELSESLRRDGLKKTTSFNDTVAIGRAAMRHSPVFESDDEDEEVSESAIEDDDDSSEWEDSDENNSGPASIDGTLFRRVDSRPNLTSRRSLLTTLMHEPDRAKALASAASRSTPAMRRSRVTSPNGPSLATTPEAGMELKQGGTRPQPIIMTTSNTHQQIALSPRTTRRNMLSTELTESLRKNLLWERQHKSTGNLSALKRRHTSQNVKQLKEHPQPTYPTKTGTNMSFTNDYFNAGLSEYHTKGW